MNQDQFLLDSGFWGWLYKLLYPVEWLMTQIMAGFHRFMVMLGMNEIGFSWVMSIVFLVIVVQACVFPLFYKSRKGMRKMQAQMAAAATSVLPLPTSPCNRRFMECSPAMSARISSTALR